MITSRSYRTETRKYQVGCGELNIRIAFKGDEEFHFILISLNSHDNQCGCCWLEVSANTLTALLRRIKTEEIDEIIKNYKNQRCAKGLESCPNAIYKAIKEAFKDRK